MAQKGKFNSINYRTGHNLHNILYYAKKKCSYKNKKGNRVSIYREGNMSIKVVKYKTTDKRYNPGARRLVIHTQVLKG